ncbi:Cysteine-rich motor neuron 1 protein [Bagarius yarrelli]|uniref:Cysteine-rich motor neuron 1 protein n=1 Tax=Bagarius yarrelli TaxID=175774 RepID=A0A556VC24_BAGYA|nr:Cysteine-rich motor neuron 1 protein [Bagarius yarrelli]
MPCSGYLILREGEKCGEWIEGACENGLVCVLTEPPSEFYAIGACTRLSNCNCSEFQCPPRRRNVMCYGLALDPCGCCSHCSRLVGQVCGGPSWRYADRMYDINNPEPEPEPVRVCNEWSCEVQGCECVCKYRKCEETNPPLYEEACCSILRQSGCQNATCSEISPPDCPEDSFLSQPHTEPGQCCPAIPAMCTCNFKTCTPKPKYCIQGGYPRLVMKGNGHPGTCCDRYECVKEED